MASRITKHPVVMQPWCILGLDTINLYCFGSMLDPLFLLGFSLLLKEITTLYRRLRRAAYFSGTHLQIPTQ